MSISRIYEDPGEMRLVRIEKVRVDEVQFRSPLPLSEVVGSQEEPNYCKMSAVVIPKSSLDRAKQRNKL